SDAWRRHFDVNVFALVSTLKVVLPALRAFMDGGVSFTSTGAATCSSLPYLYYGRHKIAEATSARAIASNRPMLVQVSASVPI
ncbi:hypothetical protein BKA82DRAFT_4187063, partial [Pisolithus tinctorius]